MTDSLIAGHDISLHRHGETLLDHVSLSVDRGRIVTLIGPNGSGKTTLARILLGLLEPDRGTVWRRPGLRIGYVPQRLALDPTLPLTAKRFLALGTDIGGKARDTALREVGIERLGSNPVQSLSGGEFQRLLLARALARGPDLLVLDEPAQGVDVGGQAALYELIRRQRDRHGCGVLLISHDLHVVMAATDEVVCLNRHVCCSGQPENVSKDQAFLELFGADAARALAVYAHDHDHVHDVIPEPGDTAGSG